MDFIRVRVDNMVLIIFSPPPDSGQRMAECLLTLVWSILLSNASYGCAGPTLAKVNKDWVKRERERLTLFQNICG